MKALLNAYSEALEYAEPKDKAAQNALAKGKQSSMKEVRDAVMEALKRKR
jgi:hypothetical protein